MTRDNAVIELNKLRGKDLIRLSKDYNITIFTKNGVKNKGWAGQLVENYLGLETNSSPKPDFGDWELKTTSLKRLKNGKLSVKETIAVTMISPQDVLEKEFKDSHLFQKLNRMLILSRIWKNKYEPSSEVYSVVKFDLDDDEIYNTVKEDYDYIREVIVKGGLEALSGRMGNIIQPRTKGAGHGSVSRAFYIRRPFVNQIVLGE